MKKLRTKSLILMFIILTLILSSFPTLTFAVESVGGLKTGGVYSIDDLKFYEADATSATVKIDGTEVDTTVNQKVIDVDCSDVTSIGAHKVTLYLNEASTPCFDGLVYLEKSGENTSESYDLSSQVISDRKNSNNLEVTKTNTSASVCATVPANFGTSMKPYLSLNSKHSAPGIYELSYKIESSSTLNTYVQIYHKDTAATSLANTGDTSISANVPTTIRTVFNTVSGVYEKYAKAGENDEVLLSAGTLTTDELYPTFYRLRFALTTNNSSAVTVTISDISESYKSILPYVESLTADDEIVEADIDGVYTISPSTSSITLGMTDAITANDVSFAGKTASVAGGDKITFSDLSLEENTEYTLTVPATAADKNSNVYGLDRIITIKTTSDVFLIASPVNGETYDVSEDIFDIYEGSSTLAYNLNGESVTSKDELSASVKLGENVLEVYEINGSTYNLHRVVFNINKTYIYNQVIEDFEDKEYTVHSVAKNKFTQSFETDKYGMSGNCVSYSVADGTSSNVQIRAMNNIAGLRNQATGANYDNRFLSGKAVCSADFCVSDVANTVIYFSFRGTQCNGRIRLGDVVDYSKTSTEDGYTLLADAIKNNDWFNLKYIFDFNLKTASMYIDDELIFSETTDDYPVADSTYLIQYRVENNDGKALTFYVDNLDFYWEIPAEITSVEFKDSVVGNNRVVNTEETKFTLTTPLRLADTTISNDYIQFYADNISVSGITVSKNETDTDYLGQGVLSKGDTQIQKYDGGEAYYQECYNGTKGTKVDITIPAQKAGTCGRIVIKSGTPVIATDWRYTAEEDLITLDKDIVIPVYFGKNGIYAKTEFVNDAVFTTVLNDGITKDLMLITAGYNGSTLSAAKTETLSVPTGSVVSRGFFASEGTSIMLWTKEDYIPLTKKVTK